VAAASQQLASIDRHGAGDGLPQAIWIILGSLKLESYGDSCVILSADAQRASHLSELGREDCVTHADGVSAIDRDVREDPVYRVMAELFRSLGHPARVRLLELLGDREQTVGELQDALELDSSGASQHLSVLRRQGLIDSRKLGTSVRCRVRDPRTLKLLALARGILLAARQESRILLGELDSGAGGGSRGSSVGRA
jgi:DNA-binding transcriptional ArsR family regulator